MQISAASTDCSHHDVVIDTDSFLVLIFSLFFLIFFSFFFFFSANQYSRCFCICINDRVGLRFVV